VNRRQRNNKQQANPPKAIPASTPLDIRDNEDDLESIDNEFVERKVGLELGSIDGV
jgi:hypothetical protein